MAWAEGFADFIDVSYCSARHHCSVPRDDQVSLRISISPEDLGMTHDLSALPTLTLPSGAAMPVLGLGTWMMGEQRRERAREVAAISLGLDLGMTLIDTAEMYADGGAEEVAGDAIAGRRDQTFVVSKVYPHNAGRRSAIAACKRSLKRLRIDYLDLYLLHWRGDIPLAETVDAFEALRREGLIRDWGVSNMDRADMEELFALSDGPRCAANQVLYHLGCRGVEWDVLPFCRQHKVAVMAYSPVGRGKLLRDRRLHAIATAAGVTPAQVALAWLLLQTGVCAIPKAAIEAHLRDNRHAADLRLDPRIVEQLDAAFPPPTAATPLAIL
jgi:diketogulonate reductase-like aldo/keto reductase